MRHSDLLRRAADVLGRYAERATPGPWWDESGVVHAPMPGRMEGPNEPGPCVHPLSEGNGTGWDGEYAALMHPPVALAMRNLFLRVLPGVKDAEESGLVGMFGWRNLRDADVIVLAATVMREEP